MTGRKHVKLDTLLLLLSEDGCIVTMQDDRTFNKYLFSAVLKLYSLFDMDTKILLL